MVLWKLSVIILSFYLFGVYGQVPSCPNFPHYHQEQPILQHDNNQQQQDSLDKIYVQCGSIGCIRARFLQLIDEYDAKSSVELLDGLVSIERNVAVPKTSNKSDNKSHINKMISRVDRYLNAHSLRLKVPTFGMDIGRNMDTTQTSTHFDLSLSLLTPTQGRNSKVRKYLLPLMLALQIKMIFALPLFLLISAALGMKSFTTSMMAIMFSGAALLRSLVGGSRGNGGASSRVSYEVKQPAPVAATFNQAPLTPEVFYPYSQIYPPTTGLAARNPEYKIYTTASNGQR